MMYLKLPFSPLDPKPYTPHSQLVNTDKFLLHAGDGRSHGHAPLAPLSPDGILPVAGLWFGGLGLEFRGLWPQGQRSLLARRCSSLGVTGTFACRNAGQGFMKSQFDIFDQDGLGERFNTEALK